MPVRIGRDHCLLSRDQIFIVDLGWATGDAGRMKKAPVEDPADDLSVSPPKQYAAGIPGVRHALEYSFEQTSVKRSMLTLLSLNQTKGIDCPGCAWPEPDHRHKNEYCENGAKHINDEATSRRVTRDFFAKHPVEELDGKSDYWLNQQGRLTEPMVKRPGATHYEPIAWDDAFGIIADELNGLASPDEAMFYVSGRLNNEAAFLLQLFARAFGTNNLPDCSNMCHESSGTGLGETLGIGKGSVQLDDIYNSHLVFVVGQNPGTNHPRMLSALEQTKKNGGQVIAVNTLPEAGLMRFKNPQQPSGVIGKGIQIADLFLKIRPGGDLALFKMLNRLVLESGDLDHDYIQAHTTGFDDFAAQGSDITWEQTLEATGLTRDEIEAVHQKVLASKSVIVCWAMGLTQHKHGVPTIREIVNFLMLRGNIGKPGAGVCPVRGHSNVQGDRTMGIWEKMPDRFLDALGAEFGFEPPRVHGVDSVGGVRAMRDGTARVFVGVAGNFVRAMSDSEVTEAALRSCSLTVQVSTKLNRSHTVTGETALILPTLGRSDKDLQAGGEQYVTVEDSMSSVHRTHGKLSPASKHLLSEVSIITRLARRTLGDSPAIPWAELEADNDAIRDRIARVVPGFEDFNERIRQPGGFTLPNPVNAGVYPTPSGKAVFSVNTLAWLQTPPGHLILQSLRSHDQWNTVPYALNDRYRGIHNARHIVMINPDDIAELGFHDGDQVDIVSVWDDGIERRARNFTLVGYPASRGSAASYYPETNVLVPLDSVASGSNTPTSKGVLVRLEPATHAAHETSD